MKNQAKIAGQIRHLMTGLGGVLIALGLVPSEQIVLFNNALDATLAAAGPLVGVSIVIAGQLWSWFDPAKKVGNGDY